MTTGRRVPAGDRESPREDDLLTRVREACRLYWAKQGHPDADAKECEDEVSGRRVSYLRVSYVDGNFTEHALIGTHRGQVDSVAIADFIALLDRNRDARAVPEVVYIGEPPTTEVRELANEHHLRLSSFEQYQNSLWNSRGYLTEQTARLDGDNDYPLPHHVDKNWALLGQQPDGSTVANQIVEWLETDGPRFVLVLGDFGTGKTFLVHVLAKRLTGRDGAVPVLVTMRDLEKSLSLDELLAQHMARHRPDDAFHPKSFRYLLSEGRVVLLFDGFDELAQRPTYDRIKQHFDVLRQAAGGRAAKVVVTSRHQHFATDSDVLNGLGRDARSIAGSRIIRLLPLGDDQRRGLVRQNFDYADTDGFLRDLERVPNLAELAYNPRMLTFIMARRDSLARLVNGSQDDESLTAGRLYEALLTDWIKHEVARQTADGRAEPLPVEKRTAALRTLAVQLWRSGRTSLPLVELGAIADGIADLVAWQIQPGEATQVIGSGTILVRSPDGDFGFIHQSVLEWFVADTARLALEAFGANALNDLFTETALTVLIADFLLDLAGVVLPQEWALRVATSTTAEFGPNGKANAALLSGRARNRLPHNGRDISSSSSNYRDVDLRGHDLTSADLAGANLTGALLAGTVLPKALTGVNLTDADLVGAQLDDTVLVNAVLDLADLRDARLLRADLTGATLTGARFDCAVLLGAIVDETALASATTWGAALPDAKPVPQFAGQSPIHAMTGLRHGEFLVTGHDDGSVRIWNTGSGLPVRTLPGHPSPVTAMAAHPNGDWLACANEDGTLRFWDPATGRLRRGLTARAGGVSAVAMGPFGDWLAVASRSGTISQLNPASGTTHHSTTVPGGGVVTLAASARGGWLVAVSNDGSVVVLDSATGRARYSLAGRLHGVLALAADPNGAWWASATDDGVVQLWDPNVSNKIMELTGPTGAVHALAVDPDGTWIAVAAGDEVRRYDLAAGMLLETRRRGSPVRALAVAPSGSWVASAGDDGTIELWAPDTEGSQRLLNDRAAGIRTLALDQTGAHLAAASTDGRVRLWDLATGTMLRPFADIVGVAHALVAAPGGEWIACADATGNVHFFDRMAEPLTIHARALPGRGMAVDPHGRWLAFVGHDDHVQLWDPATKVRLHTLRDKVDTHVEMAVARRGSWLAIAQGGFISLCEPVSGAEGRRPRLGVDARALAVDPHGAWLAVADRAGPVALWELSTGDPIRTLGDATIGAVAIAVAPDAAWLAIAGADGRVQMWDPARGARLHTPPVRVRGVRAMVADPRGRWLAIAGDDGAIRLWDPWADTVQMCLVGDDDGAVILHGNGEHQVHGAPTSMWWAAGLCRFEPSEIDDVTLHIAGWSAWDGERGNES